MEAKKGEVYLISFIKARPRSTSQGKFSVSSYLLIVGKVRYLLLHWRQSRVRDLFQKAFGDVSLQIRVEPNNLLPFSATARAYVDKR